jgi:hypothetical protein
MHGHTNATAYLCLLLRSAGIALLHQCLQARHEHSEVSSCGISYGLGRQTSYAAYKRSAPVDMCIDIKNVVKHMQILKTLCEFTRTFINLGLPADFVCITAKGPTTMQSLLERPHCYATQSLPCPRPHTGPFPQVPAQDSSPYAQVAEGTRTRVNHVESYPRDPPLNHC